MNTRLITLLLALVPATASAKTTTRYELQLTDPAQLSCSFNADERMAWENDPNPVTIWLADYRMDTSALDQYVRGRHRASDVSVFEREEEATQLCEGITSLRKKLENGEKAGYVATVNTSDTYSYELCMNRSCDRKTCKTVFHEDVAFELENGAKLDSRATIELSAVPGPCRK